MEDFTLDAGNTAWILISATLVLLMTTPALAFFYGGMTRSKSVLNMMMMSFGAAGVVGVVWVAWGYSMSFGSDVGTIVGNPFTYFGLSGLLENPGDNNLGASGVPSLVYAGFQATFAIITVALITGAIADRVKYSHWLFFAGVWATLVYFPMCHMVWGGGMLGGEGGVAEALSTPLDYAGGAVVHMNAGMAGLVLALVAGRRKGFGKEPMRPHNLPFVMLGAALLWVGWFGFNAGSAGAANQFAGLAWINTMVATAAACLGWLIVEKIRDGKPSALGAASGVVAGLVAITPAAGFVSPLGAIAIGAITGAVCALAVALKYRWNFDDSLDVVGVHLVGGLMGTVLLGFFALSPEILGYGAWDGMAAGLFYGGGLTQLATQIVVAIITLLFSGVATAIIALFMNAISTWRIAEKQEINGIDFAVHGESAYEGLGSGRIASEVR